MQAAGGISSIEEMFYNLPDLLQTNREILDEVGTECGCEEEGVREEGVCECEEEGVSVYPLKTYIHVYTVEPRLTDTPQQRTPMI